MARGDEIPSVGTSQVWLDDRGRVVHHHFRDSDPAFFDHVPVVVAGLQAILSQCSRFQPVTLSPPLNPLRELKLAFLQAINADYRDPDSPDPETLPEKVDLKRCIPFIFLHLGCLAVIWVGISWPAVVAALLLYLLRMFAITGFYHRYFSHRSFRANRAFQFVMAVWGNTAMQRGPLWWASTHRHHHNHSDEEEDKHSPGIKGFWWSHIGWMTCTRNFPTDYAAVKDLNKFPELRFINRHDQLVPWLYSLSMLLLGWGLERWFPGTGVTMWQFFVWTVFISTTVLLHGTLFINSLAHVYGKKRFQTNDDSRNSLLLAIITLGEGWHNNHHRYPHSTRQGFAWWEFDLTYYGLKTLSWLGIIRDLRPVPARIHEEGGISSRSDS